ncbi:MAG TPA: L,D-transpeptidase family protein, partial [Methyloradius sp.]
MPWNATAIDHFEQVKFTGNNNFAANYTESLLVKSLLQITQGQLQQASQTIYQVIQTAPNFKLAYLVRGDLLMARAQQLQSFGSAPQSNSDKVSDFRAEARMRLEHYLAKQAPSSIPEPLWQIDASQQYVIVVDADKSRLYLYRNINNQPQYVADYYVTVGRNGSEKSSEGDKRTPVGVYYADSQLLKKLPDFYGNAAYPLNYPNEWDRHQGKNGHGIWL